MDWIGDGYCDDGNWGLNFMCEQYVGIVQIAEVKFLMRMVIVMIFNDWI